MIHYFFLGLLSIRGYDISMEKHTFASELSNLFSQGHKITLLKGETFQDSDRRPILNYIGKGFVTRYVIAEDGNLKVQSLYAPDYLFPLTIAFKSLFDLDIYDGREVVYYKALTDAVIYSIETDTFLEAIKINPLLYKELLYEAGLRFHSNIQWLENTMFKSVQERLVHLLVYLSTQFSVLTPQGTQLLFALTRQDIANILGVARETVSIHMVQLSHSGLVILEKKLIIPDINKLKSMIR